jgi:hypothetical protein
MQGIVVVKIIYIYCDMMVEGRNLNKKEAAVVCETCFHSNEQDMQPRRNNGINVVCVVYGEAIQS